MITPPSPCRSPGWRSSKRMRPSQCGRRTYVVFSRPKEGRAGSVASCAVWFRCGVPDLVTVRLHCSGLVHLLQHGVGSRRCQNSNLSTAAESVVFNHVETYIPVISVLLVVRLQRQWTDCYASGVGIVPTHPHTHNPCTRPIPPIQPLAGPVDAVRPTAHPPSTYHVQQSQLFIIAIQQ